MTSSFLSSASRRGFRLNCSGSLFSAGLNAGDEILQLNGKDSHSLNFSDMKAAFSQASLALTVNTLPSVERRQLCYLPPRRSDAEGDLYTDIFSQSQGEKKSQLGLM